MVSFSQRMSNIWDWIVLMFEGITCAITLCENNQHAIDRMGSNLSAYKVLFNVGYENGTKPLKQRVEEKRLIMIEVATIGIANSVCLLGCLCGMFGTWSPREVFHKYTNHAANKIKHQHTLCAICQDAVTIDDSIEVTKCGHCYHEHCLSQWIDGQGKDSCPYCRKRITF